AQTATMSPVYTSGAPPRVTTTPVTVRPAGSVSSRVTSAPVSNVTLACPSSGRTAMTSASDLACTRHGYPSHQVHRMHALRHAPRGRWASPSMIPEGPGSGWSPLSPRPAEISAIRGSCDTAGHGYGWDRGPSVGSSPPLPCTWYNCSACEYQGSKSSYDSGHAGEIPSTCASSPKSCGRSRYNAAPYSLVAPPTK